MEHTLSRRIVLAALLCAPASASFAVTNSGFEADPIPPPGGVITGWTTTAADQVILTDGDDGTDYGVYAEFNIVIDPLQGDQSALLGTPKKINESQNRGLNELLSDPFVPTRSDLFVSMRLLSLEHRGDDQFIIEIVDDETDEVIPDLSGISFEFTKLESEPNTSPLSQATTLCTGLGPICSLTIDVGKRNKRPFDSGKHQVRIAGLPVGESVRLRYALVAGNNEAHATFVYVDNVNQLPEGVLRINPGGDAANPAFEGDFVVADCLESFDPDGDDVVCTWVASGGGWQSDRTATGDTAIFWFPDESPTPTITLTVTDPLGASSVVQDTVNLINAEPVVNAVNVEVLAGTSGETVCRFIDAGLGGFNDDGVIGGQEEAHVLISPASFSASDEEWQPSLSSGFYVIPADAPSGTCTVSDGLVSGSDDFIVREVDPADLATRLEDNGSGNCAAGNETIDCAYPLEADWTYLGTIAQPTDIDVFRVLVPDPDNPGAFIDPPVGTELVASLTGQPSDYDLLVFSNGGSAEASPFFNAPFFNAPFFNAPFFNAPFFNAPFFNAQFDSVPFFNAPFFNAPFFNAPFFNAPIKKSPFFNAGEFNRGFTDFPLSEVGLAAPDGSNISGSDISVAEIGSRNLEELQSTPGIALKALSAEPGTQAEKVLVKVGPGETAIYVAVVSNDLAFSSVQPYSLTLEASSPPSQEELLAGTGFCDAEAVDPSLPLSATNPPKYEATWQALATGDPSQGQTVILTQRERFELEQAEAAAAAVAAGQYADVGAYWAAFWTKIDEYAAAVGGELVSVAGGTYEQADRNPCKVEVRNALAQAIRDTYIVQPAANGNPADWRNSGAASVVLVGGQNVVPVFATPDEAVVGYEGDFTTDLWVRPGTPLAVAVAEGNNLTDAPYVDLEPTPFRGRLLYLEDKPVARLVESPEAIMANIDAFLTRLAGQQANTGNLAVGYDFFCDGTEEAAAILGVTPINGPPCTNEDWDAETLKNAYLNGGTEMCTAAGAAPPLELALVNAHATTYAYLSSLGFAQGLVTGDFSDTLASTESAQCLDGTLSGSIGCHSGLNIPDAWALTDELQLPFDAARDWVEELGFMVAPRGYGLGDNTVANRGTEGIMTLVFEELAAGYDLGTAVVRAKRRYVMRLREVDVHDEKSLVSLGVFAPPQLTYPSLAGQQQAAQAASAAATSAFWGPLSIKVRESAADGSESFLVGSAGGFATYDILEFTDDGGRGRWFEVDPGDAQATYGRPLLPVTLPVEDRDVQAAPDQTRIHGVALVSRDAPVAPCPIDGRPSCHIAGRYTDLEDVDSDDLADFNPVFPLPQHDWVVYEDDLDLSSVLEPQTCVETLAPTQLGVASTLDSGGIVSQSLIIGAGQFRCEPTEARVDAPDQVVGQHRLYEELQLTALHPLGVTQAEAQLRDLDFDPPQVQVQQVLSDPDTNDITATVQATDALTGGNGISEIIGLVFWDEDENASGSGIVESYSVKNLDLSVDPFSHVFTFANARDRRVAFQYIDGAGNLTQKSLKGSLIRAIDVNILDTLLNPVGDNSISVFVGEFCSLQLAVISYQIDDGEVQTFALDNPPAGVTVTVTPPCSGDPDDVSDATLLIEGLDFGLEPGGGGGSTLTVVISSPGATGSDTAQLAACSDPDEPDVADNADIIGCGFSVDGDVVVIDMFIVGVLDPEVQYRVELPQYGALFKRFQNGKISKPPGTQLTVVEGPSSLQFRIGNLDNLGWDGVSPIDFKEATQSGVPGQPSQGIPDETAVFTGVP